MLLDLSARIYHSTVPSCDVLMLAYLDGKACEFLLTERYLQCCFDIAYHCSRGRFWCDFEPLQPGKLHPQMGIDSVKLWY